MKYFDPGIEIEPTTNPLGFQYGDNVFGPEVENRRLEDIRKSLLDPNCEGPEIVYSIAMDVGKEHHKPQLKKQHLLFGVVTYAEGRLGKEPIRSQGHIHAISKYSEGWSTPEVYEIWTGKAFIYMQETAKDNPGRCYAVHAEPGQVVIVPPGWAHATISADPDQPLTFGAWCIRDYAFLYEEVRTHNGLAWYPILDHHEKINWKANPKYEHSPLEVKEPSSYEELNLDQVNPIYNMYEADKELFDFVVNPGKYGSIWKSFVP